MGVWYTYVSEYADAAEHRRCCVGEIRIQCAMYGETLARGNSVQGRGKSKVRSRMIRKWREFPVIPRPVLAK